MKKILMTVLVIGFSIGMLQAQSKSDCIPSKNTKSGEKYDLQDLYDSLSKKHNVMGDITPVSTLLKPLLYNGEKFKNCIYKQDLTNILEKLKDPRFKVELELTKFKEAINLAIHSKDFPAVNIATTESKTIITVSASRKERYRITMTTKIRDSLEKKILYIIGKIEISKGIGIWTAISSKDNDGSTVPSNWLQNIIVILSVVFFSWIVWRYRNFIKQGIVKLIPRVPNGNNQQDSGSNKGKSGLVDNNNPRQQDNKENEKLQEKQTEIEKLRIELNQYKYNVNNNIQEASKQTNADASERGAIVFLNKENDELKKEIDELKIRNNDLEKKYSNLVEKLNKSDKLEPSQSPNKLYAESQATTGEQTTTKTFFLSTPTPTPDGYCTFLDQRKPQFDPTSSLYRFQLVNNNEDEAEFWFESRSNTVSWALKNPESHLKPACEYVGLNSSATEIKTSQPGKAVRMDNTWKVRDKAVIKFI